MGGLSYGIICTIFKVPGYDVAYPFESKVSTSQSAVIDEIDLAHGIEERRLDAASHEKKFGEPTVEEAPSEDIV